VILFNAAIDPDAGPKKEQRVEFFKLFECVRLSMASPTYAFTA
jgi:hypothetical protein